MPGHRALIAGQPRRRAVLKFSETISQICQKASKGEVWLIFLVRELFLRTVCRELFPTQRARIPELEYSAI